MKKGLLLLTILCVSLFSEAQVYFLNEDFSTANAGTPPAGWTIERTGGLSTDSWKFNNPGGRSVSFPVIGNFAIFDSQRESPTGGAEKVSLVSPFVDCSFSQQILLYFDHQFVGGRQGKGTVEVFDGNNWVASQVYTDSTSGIESAVLNISALAGGKSNARFRFTWEGDSSYYWLVDNVKIFAPLTRDAGIRAIETPTMPFNSGVNAIRVSIVNEGVETLTSATIKWTVDGVAQTPYSWTGSLPLGQAASGLQIGTYNFPSGLLKNVKVWVENPNGQADLNRLNDTLQRRLAAQLCSTYTIGGSNPDFVSFGDAVSALNAAGVGCPVVFKVRDGVYDEQVKIFEVLGSSAVNTIRFEGESGDSSKTVLHYQQSNPANDFTMSLSGTDYVGFSRMGIRRSNGSGNMVIQNGSHHVSVENCWLGNVSSPGSSVDSMLVFKGNAMRDADLRIDQVAGSKAKGILIEGNVIRVIQVNNSYDVQIRLNEISAIQCAGDTLVAISGNKSFQTYGYFDGRGNGYVQLNSSVDVSIIGNSFISYAGIYLNYSISVWDSRLVSVKDNSIFSQEGSETRSMIFMWRTNGSSISGNEIYAFNNGIEISEGSFIDVVHNRLHGLSGGSTWMGNDFHGISLIGSANGIQDNLGIFRDSTWVTGNRISGFKSIGILSNRYNISFSNQYSFILDISNNIIDSVGTDGISISHNYPGISDTNNVLLIRSNRIKGIKNGSGVLLSLGAGRISNNYIQGLGRGISKGIVLSTSVGTVSVLHNSIHVMSTDIENGKALEILGGAGHVIKNNIFANSGGGFAAYINSSATTFDVDYNNYYSSNRRLGYYASKVYDTLSQFIAATGKDAHSFAVNPYFESDTVLVPHHTVLNNSGLLDATASTDIDGTPRGNNPDMGAKEFDICVNDAGINGIYDLPNPIPTGSYPVKVVLQNQGSGTLSSTTIGWSVNGEVQTPFTWSGSLLEKGSDTVEIGAYTFTSGKLFKVRAWTVGANGGTDCSAYNDSSKVAEVGTQLCGVYTIGGVSPDFASFGDAVSALNAAGVGCPVVFKVRDGVYDEQVKIFEVLGSSAVNTIRFEGESGDSSKTVLHYQQSNPANDFTMSLSGTDYVGFSRMGIRRSNGSGNMVIQNGSHHVSVENCWLGNVSSPGSSVDSMLVFKGNAMRDADLRIDQVAGSKAKGILIEGNVIRVIQVNNSYDVQIRLNEISAIQCAGDTLVAISGNKSFQTYGYFDGRGNGYVQLNSSVDVSIIGNSFISYAGIYLNYSISVWDSRLVSVKDNSIFSQEGSETRSMIFMWRTNGSSISGNEIYAFNNGIEISEGSFIDVVHNRLHGLSGGSTWMGNDFHGISLIGSANGIQDNLGIFRDSTWVTGNRISGFKSIGILSNRYNISFSNQYSFILDISNNIIDSVGTDGISISHNYPGISDTNNVLLIRSNRIKGIKNGSGVLLSLGAGRISNNYIQGLGRGISKGIVLSTSVGTVSVLHNSIHVMSTDIENGKALEILGGAGHVIKNNIFANSGGGYAAYINTLPANKDWDYNNYYSSSENRFGYIAGQNFNSLGSWGAVLGGDANSKNLNPVFASDTLLQPYEKRLNGAGIGVADVPLDIDGEIRNQQAPDMGAQEFMVDFGITRVVSPENNCPQGVNAPIKVALRQYGDVPFIDLKLAYQINGGAIVYDTVPGTITNDIEYTFKQRSLLTSAGTNSVLVWLVDNADDNLRNDTLVQTITVAPAFNPLPSTLALYSNENKVLDAGSGFALYQWSTGDSTQTININVAGTYSITVNPGSACVASDTVVVTTTDVPPPPPPCYTTYSYFSASVKPFNLPYLWQDHYYSKAGTYLKRLVNAAGCDSIAQLTLTILPEFSYGQAGTYTVGQSIAPLIPTISGTKIAGSKGKVSTIAGTGVAGYVNGNGTQSQFNSPTDLEIEAAGTILVADKGNNVLRRIGPDGAVSVAAGNQVAGSGSTDGGIFNATFSSPTGLAVDSLGNVYIADQGSNKIRKITRDGNVETIAGTGVAGLKDTAALGARFNSPYDVAVDETGNVYITDQLNGSIRKVDTSGFVTTIAGNGANGFANGSGSLARMNNPLGLLLSYDGQLIVADNQNYAIRKSSLGGDVSTLIRDTLSIGKPGDVVGDGKGNLFVSDQLGHRILQINANAAVTTFAGSGTPGKADGTLLTASFNSPAGLAIDSLGSIYVADQGNHLIRKIESGFSVSPALPIGMFIDSLGAIKGTPTETKPLTNYVIIGENAFGSDTASVSLEVVGCTIAGFNPFPDTLSICGTSTILDAGLGFQGYLWNTGDTTQSISASLDGKYRLRVLDSTGCQANDSVYLSLIDARILHNDTTICEGSELSLVTTATSGMPGSLSERLITYYSFNGSLKDESGNGNDGIENNVYYVPDRNLVDNSALEFTGNDYSFVNLPLLTTLNNRSIVSFSFWIYNRPGDQGTILGHWGNNYGSVGVNPGFVIGKAGNIIYTGNYAGCCGVSNKTPLPENSWSHILVSFNGNLVNNQRVKIFVNGKEDSLLNGITNPVIGEATSSFLGLRNIDNDLYGDPYQGIIDDFAIFDKNLDEIEINSLLRKRTVKWNTGETSQVLKVKPTKSETYFVRISDEITSCVDSININVVKIEGFNPLEDTTKVCGFQSILNAGNGFKSYSWSTSDTTSILRTNLSGTYLVQVSDEFGCKAYDTTYLSIVNAEIAQQDTTICLGQPVLLTLQGTNQISSVLRSKLISEISFDGSVFDKINNIYAGAGNVNYVQNRFGDSGKAIRFSGNSGVVMGAHNSYSAIPSSISFWFKIPVSGGGCVISKSMGEGDFQRRLGIYVSESGVSFNIGIYGDAVSLSEPISVDKWHHVLITIDSFNTVSITLDGIFNATRTWSNNYILQSNISWKNYPFRFGYVAPNVFEVLSGAGGRDYFSGEIDDFRIFSTALKENQIPDLINSQNSVKWSNGSSGISMIDYPLFSKQYYTIVTDGFTSCYDTVNVNVVALDTNIIVLDQLDICPGSSTRLQAGIASSYQWLLDGFPIENATSRILTVSDSGSYSVIVTNDLGCSDTSTVVRVTIKSNPSAGTWNTVAPVCSGTNTSTLQIRGNVGTLRWQYSTNGTTYVDMAGLTDSTYQATNLTSTRYYRVIATNSCGSDTSAVQTVVVNPTPVVSFTVNNTTQSLSGNLFTFTNTTPETTGDTYVWALGNGFTITTRNTSFSYTLPGTYSVSLTVRSALGCESTTQQVIEVVDLPEAGQITGSATVCGDVNSNALSVTGSSGTLQWQQSANNISFSSINSATSSSYTAINLTATTYYRVIASKNGLFDTSAVATITVNPKPTVSFTVNIASQVQAGNSFVYTNTSTGGSTYLWRFGNGAAATTLNATYSYAAAGSYVVRLVVTSALGCQDSTSTTVTVTAPQPPVAGQITGSAAVCGPINSNTLSVAGSAGTLQWQQSANNISFSNINTATSSSYTATNLSATTYFRVIASRDGLTDTSGVATITLNPSPVVSFMVNNATQPLSGNLFVFTNTTSVTAGDTYLWDMGNGFYSASKHVTFIYPDSGRYTVSLSVKSALGCESSAQQDVLVVDLPEAGVMSGSAEVCGPVNSNTLSVTGSSGTLQWQQSANNISFSNINTATSSSYTATNLSATTYFRVIASKNGLFDTSGVASITVNPKPTVSFTVNNASQVLTGNSFVFTNTSTGGSTYLWRFGNGASATTQNATYSYTTAGSYVVRLVVTSALGCQDSTSTTVTVTAPQPPVAGQISGSASVCGPVNSNTISVAGSSGTLQWQQSANNISFSNINSATSSSYTATNLSATTYFRVIASRDGLTDTSGVATITVNPKPTVSFTVNNATQVLTGNSFVFTNTSTGGSTYLWRFGNGVTATTQNATYSYAAAGSYVVRLVVTSAAGCRDSSSTTVTVTVPPPPPPVAAGNLYAAGTTCAQFNARTGTTLNRLCYTVSSGRVSAVTPSSFMYYVKVTAPSASFTVNISQTVSRTGFRLFTVNTGGSVVSGDNCARVTSVSSPSTGQARASVTRATVGRTYIIGVRYDTRSLVGYSTNGTLSANYTFVARIGNTTLPNSNSTVTLYPNNCVGVSGGQLARLPELGGLPGASAGVDKTGSETRLAIRVYPNPSNSRFNVLIEGSDRQTKGVLRIMNAQGQVVEEIKDVKPGTELQLGVKYISGTYTAVFIQGNQTTRQRMVKY